MRQEEGQIKPPLRHLFRRDAPFVMAALIAVFAFGAVFFGVQAQSALTITSGPTSGGITEDIAVIRWQTDVAATTVVDFGTTTSLGQTYRKLVPIEETEPYELSHAMTLSELQAGTKYYYRARSVAEDGTSVQSALFQFTTAGTAVTSLVSVTVRKPASGQAYTAQLWFEAVVIGDARTVKFSVTPSAGGASLTYQGAAASSDQSVWSWTGPDELSSGQYAVEAVATGADASGSSVTLRSEKVAFTSGSTVQRPAEKPAPTPPPASVPAPAPVPVAEPSDEPTPTAAPATGESADATSGVPTTGVSPTPVEGTSSVPASVGTGSAGSTESALTVEQVASAAALNEEANAVEASIVAPVSTGAAAECAKAGVQEARCSSWAAASFADTTCADAGIITVDSCESFLAERGGGTFPGCAGKTEDQCAAAKALALAGYLDTEDKRSVDALLGQMTLEDHVVAVSGVMAINDKVAGDAALRDSAVAEGTETSPSVLIIDTDRDGLPNDFERSHGTDPEKIDSDGDGAGDAEELAAGTDPLGNGNTRIILDSTAKALVSGVPLAQPRGAGTEDTAYGVRVERGTGKTGRYALRGRCTPGATCLVYLYSYVPMVLTASADANGNFTYALDDALADGSHVAYVAVTDDTGQITTKSAASPFFVREAQAVSRETFLAPDPALLAPPEKRFRYAYLLGVAGVVVLAGIFAWLMYRSMQAQKA